MSEKNYISYEYVLKCIDSSGFGKGEFLEKLGLSRQTLYTWKENGGTSFTNYKKIVKLLGDKMPETDWDVNNDKQITLRKTSELDNFNILHVPESVQAGIFSGEPNPIDLLEMIPYNIPDIPFKAYSFNVSGNSMEPTLFAGEKVIVTRKSDTNVEDLINEYIYVLNTSEGLFIKRIRKQNRKTHIWLVSDNIDFDDIEIPVSKIRGIHKVRRFIKWQLRPIMSGESEETSIKKSHIFK